MKWKIDLIENGRLRTIDLPDVANELFGPPPPPPHWPLYPVSSTPDPGFELTLRHDPYSPDYIAVWQREAEFGTAGEPNR
jgi:hypothetical protein